MNDVIVLLLSFAVLPSRRLMVERSYHRRGWSSQERDFVRRLDEQKRKLNAQRKRHLNRAATDGRPR
eukprot:symbB.v1.2.010414.t1/scaffold655.1/size176010/1